MKVLIIVRVLWPGGVQRTAFAEAEGLVKLGDDVDLVFIRDTGRLKYATKIKYSVIYDNSVNERPLGKILKKITLHYNPQRGTDATVDIDLILKFVRSLRTRYDIVYCFDEFTGIFSKTIKKSCNSKIVVVIHEVSDRHLSLSHFIQKMATRGADAVITNTSYNIDLLRSFKANNAIEIYPGLNITNENISFKDREDLAISVTMWDSGRHPEVFIEIAKNLQRGKLMLIGNWADKSYFNEFKNLIIKSGVQEKLEVTGPVSEGELKAYYLKAKVFIRFGYNEKGPGMGSLEAISYGIPIIWNKGIGINEILQDGVNGFVSDPFLPFNVAEKTYMIFNDEEIWNNFHNANLNLANDFTWEKHNEKLHNLFKKLLDNANMSDHD